MLIIITRLIIKILMITVILIIIANNNINTKILKAKRVIVPEARGLFNKNVMLAPCVTPSIHCSVLSVYFDCCRCF